MIYLGKLARRPIGVSLQVLALMSLLLSAHDMRAQSPEMTMREFATSQIKKGCRSIGFGGDGATWGNYSVLWRDHNTVLADYGQTTYTNGNNFRFEAAAITSPLLWHRLVIYEIAAAEQTNQVGLSVKSPGLGSGSVKVTGTGSDIGAFTKFALVLPKGFAVGGLVARETSSFNVASDADPGQTVSYQTHWRPTGGIGLTWQPSKRFLFGSRYVFNNDHEERTDSLGTEYGMVRSRELRWGGSAALWKGALVDGAATRLFKSNALAGTRSTQTHPNLGFEQAFANGRFALRFGRDETSPTAGATYRYRRLKIDGAYVNNMGQSRVGTLFGTHSNSGVVTVTVDFNRDHIAAR